MASFVKMSEIAADVMKNVGLVSGTGVQIYSEPNIHASIQRMFDMLFRKRYWEWLSDWHTFQLDGTTGLVAGSFVDICDSIEDIREVRDANNDRKVARPVNREHLRASGSSALYYTALNFSHPQYLTKVLKFWPITATDAVDVYARTKPSNFVPNDIVPFPRDVIAHAAAWDLLDSDGINPTAASKAQSLFDVTYRDLITTLSDDSIGIGGSRSRVPLTIRTL